MDKMLDHTATTLVTLERQPHVKAQKGRGR